MFDFLCLFSKKFRILISVILYLIAGAALFTFVPDLTAWAFAKNHITVPATVVSAEARFFESGSPSSKHDYLMTLQCELEDGDHYYSYYASHAPTGKKELHLYRTKDDRYQVFDLNIGGILLLTGIAAGAAFCGTRLILTCREKKENA